MRYELTDGRVARAVFTDRSQGDLGIDAGGVDERRAAVAPLPWTALRQVHGAEVVVVTEAGEHAGVAADAAVTAVSHATIAVQTADCAPIVLVAANGGIGVVHAGWRGLLDGVVASAVERLGKLVPGPIHAALGPCIGPECYEFGAADLEVLVERFGSRAAGTTSDGEPALDLTAAVEAALAEQQVDIDRSAWACTSCGGRWFSHRARAEPQRQVLAAWIEDPA